MISAKTFSGDALIVVERSTRKGAGQRGCTDADDAEDDEKQLLDHLRLTSGRGSSGVEAPGTKPTLVRGRAGRDGGRLVTQREQLVAQLGLQRGIIAEVSPGACAACHASHPLAIPDVPRRTRHQRCDVERCLHRAGEAPDDERQD